MSAGPSSAAAAAALPPYRATIEPEWIDYNGHLRDAYYGLILSHATDDLMDRVGLDAAYRSRTHCTLYTLEVHIHYLREVKADDLLTVTTMILDCDHKRIHAGSLFACERLAEPVATAECMLMHVHQGETVASAPFPTDIETRLLQLRLAPEARAAFAPGSRAIAIKRR